MSEPDQNYGLRPKRTATTKGKYREMVGISSPKKTDRVSMEEEQDEVAVASNSKGKSRRILVLPIVVKEGSENVSNNEIEIEIMDGVSVSELTDEVELEISAATGDEQESESEPKSKQTASDPSQHIDEILEKNDKLLESIPEGPQFKKRKSKGAAGTEIFTTKTIQEMINRRLTSEEEMQIQQLLLKGNVEAIFEMVFGPEAENRTRKCYECQELVEGSDDVYSAHYDEVHQCEPAFACEICDQVNNSASEYHTHIKEHFKQLKPSRAKKRTTLKKESSEEADDSQDGSGGSNGGFVCDICGKTLKHQKSLYSHRRTHTDAKAVCHICGTTLKSARYLHHHLLLHKDVDKPHKCDKCGKAFFSSSALKVHHYYNHEDHPGKFQCNICNKTFKAKQGLQFHMDSHSNELRYECSYCQKRFRGAKTRRVHEMRHREANEPNKYSCNICNKTFKTRQTLKNHEDVHASFNRYQCSLCEKRFKLRKSCLAHIRVHHNEERTEQQANADEGEMAVESLLAEGEEYIVTLEEGTEVEVIMQDDGQVQHQLVPEADVECEIDNMS